MKKAGAYELIDIKTFLGIVECGSISKAASSLGIAKSVVSQRLARLEGALGVALLHRSHLGVSLTTEGEHFCDRAMEAIDLLESAADLMVHKSSSLSGVLKVCAPMTFGTRFLSPILNDFLKLYPRLELHLQLQDRIVDLAAEGFDLGVRITRSSSGIDGRVARLAHSRRVVCCSPDYGSKQGVPRSLEELEAHRQIGYSYDNPQRLWHFSGMSTPGPPPPKVGRIVTNNGEVMANAALAGLGLAVLPIFIVHQHLREGSLIQVSLEVEPTADQIFVVCPLKNSKRRRVQVLEAFLKEAFAGQPTWERDLHS